MENDEVTESGDDVRGLSSTNRQARQPRVGGPVADVPSNDPERPSTRGRGDAHPTMQARPARDERLDGAGAGRGDPDPIFRIGVDGATGVQSRLRARPHDAARPGDRAQVYERLPAEVADTILVAGRRAVDEQAVQQLEYTLDVQGDGRGTTRAWSWRAAQRIRPHRQGLHGPHASGARARARAGLQPRRRQIDAELPRARRRGGVLLGVNRALERAAGIPEEAWIWKSLLDAVHREAGHAAGHRTSNGCAR